jgi:hypothetical protein
MGPGMMWKDRVFAFSSIHSHTHAWRRSQVAKKQMKFQ